MAWFATPRGILALVGGLAVLVLILVTVVAVDRRRHDELAGPVEGRMTREGVELRHPAGAVLTVPAGALPVGTTVTLQPSTASELSQLGALQPDGSGWDIQAGQDPQASVGLSIPYNPRLVPGGARPLIVTYDKTSGWWIPVAGEADPAAGRLHAQLPTFSLKSWILDRVDTGDQVVKTASWLEYQIGRLLNNRATKPSCRPRPTWVVDVVTVEEDNAQLFACVEDAGEGFAINMVNNRGFPVAVELDVPVTSARGSYLDDGLAGMVEQIFATTSRQRVFLLPTGSATATYDPVPSENGHVQGHVRHDAAAMLVMLAAEVLRLRRWDIPLPNGKEAGIWNVDCVEDMLDSGGKIASSDIVAAFASLTNCLTNTLANEAGQWGFDAVRDLWNDEVVDRLPAGARQAVSGLRVLHGAQAARWSLTAADLLINDSDATADLLDVAVHWRRAPVASESGTDVWLHMLTPAVNAEGTSGFQRDGQLGGRSFPHSTGAWVGCDGTAATLTYDLGGKYQQLDTTVGLAPTTPASVTARIDFVVDGTLTMTVDVSRDNPVPVSVILTGAQQLTVSAIKTSGTCASTPAPYGTLGDARLLARNLTASTPQQFIGTWRGTITEPDSNPDQYPMELVLNAGHAVATVGTVAYQVLECGGTVTLSGASNISLQLVERIEYGTGCVSVTYIHLRKVDDTRLSVTIFESPDPQSLPCCWGTLTKQ